MNKTLLTILLFPIFTVSAQNFVLDETFNIGTGANVSVFELEKLNDGRILIAGNFTMYNDTPIVAIAMINPDGSLDESFDPEFEGTIITDFVIEEDGKIMAVSEVQGVMRFNSDGSLDETFVSPVGALASHVVKQGDKYIISDPSINNYNAEGNLYHNIVRLNYDGSVDATFTPTNFGEFNYAKLLLQDDGKLLVFGSFETYNGTEIKNIMRLEADGSLDATFNPGSGSSGTIREVAQQSNGKYIVTGLFFSFNDIPCNLMVRLENDGNIDETFSYYSTIGEAEDGIIGYDIIIRENNKILISGKFYDYDYDLEDPDGSVPVNFLRLNPDGSHDTTFTIGEGFNYSVFALAPDGDKIVVGGTFSTFNELGQNRVARLKPEVLAANEISSSTFMIYPNPVSSNLFISVPKDFPETDIILTDISGKQVYSGHFNGYDLKNINVSGLASGIYFLELTDGNKIVTKKIIKE